MKMFYTHFEKYCSNLKIDAISPIKLLYLPRNTRENYTSNDRPEPLVPDISEIIINNGGLVLDTYNINNISVQMALVQAASTIVVHWGSAFYVNCGHLQNKTIILLEGNVHVNQVRTIPFNNSFFGYIASRNKIIPIFSYIQELRVLLESANRLK
jgi:hypothetical protein